MISVQHNAGKQKRLPSQTTTPTLVVCGRCSFYGLRLRVHLAILKSLRLQWLLQVVVQWVFHVLLGIIMVNIVITTRKFMGPLLNLTVPRMIVNMIVVKSIVVSIMHTMNMLMPAMTPIVTISDLV